MASQIIDCLALGETIEKKDGICILQPIAYQLKLLGKMVNLSAIHAIPKSLLQIFKKQGSPYLTENNKFTLMSLTILWFML